MNNPSIRNIPFYLALTLISGCLTDEPDFYAEHSTPYGMERELGWQTESGTFFVRTSPGSPRLENERPRPEDPSTHPMERSTPPPHQRKSPKAPSTTARPPSVADPSPDTNDLACAILGTWSLDKDATMQANRILADDVRESLRRGLEINPFDLTITNGSYISRGKLETIEDRYEVVSARGDTVTLRLTPVKGGAQRGARNASLTVKQGKLLFDTPVGVVLVLKRASGQTPDTAMEEPVSRHSPF